MSVFGSYSRYYNLLYQDKDYSGEAAYINALIGRHLPGSVRILDLGCGTGKHDLILAKMGHDVTGIDMSHEMLAVANSFHSSVSFLHGDIRTVRLDKTFDAIISLFHVMSYQTSNNDLAAAFTTARAHLKPGGIFIFDCWYGPGVLTDRPTVRVKRLEDAETTLTRIVEPVMFPNSNLVELNYQIIARDKESGAVEEVRETHLMRYLFNPEIESLAHGAGMSILETSEWMTGREPGFDTWGVCYVVKG